VWLLGGGRGEECSRVARCWGLAIVLASLITGGGASAQDRPSEAELFGATPPPVTPGAPAPPSESVSAAATPEAALDALPTPSAQSEAADPLTIGGLVYQRFLVSGNSVQEPGEYTLRAPTWLDVYLDARPNDRIRAYTLARVMFDRTLADDTPGVFGGGSPGAAEGTSGTASLDSLTQQGTRQPKFMLDQLWLRFDLAHRLFVTVGVQHVHWGTGRFWAPTDYLHLQRRNPLDTFDARPGTAMIKLHLPVESKAWNFYGYALSESTDRTDSLSQIAVAGRAEFVLGTMELGFGAFLGRGHSPRFAADLSLGLGDFDLYSELAVRDAAEIDRVEYSPEGAESSDEGDGSGYPSPESIDAAYPVYRYLGYRPQLVVGATYSQKYTDNDTMTLGAEFFFNGLGYGDSSPYVGLVLPHSSELSDPATFLYLGTAYAAVFANFPAPFSLEDHTFGVSTIANLSDQSLISRFDYSVVMLRKLRVEAFVDFRYGRPDGEFRFGINEELGGYVLSRAPDWLDFGFALRMSL
jgi:hypothetical protein